MPGDPFDHPVEIGAGEGPLERPRDRGRMTVCARVVLACIETRPGRIGIGGARPAFFNGPARLPVRPV